MTGKLLLDTNAAIRLLQNDRVVGRIVKEATDVYLASTVLGELYFGALNSRHSQLNLQRLENFAAGLEILVCGSNTAKIYGGIRANLKAAGRPIPLNDVWIAASALEHDLTLVTRDAHFSFVPNLKTERW